MFLGKMLSTLQECSDPLTLFPCSVCRDFRESYWIKPKDSHPLGRGGGGGPKLMSTRPLRQSLPLPATLTRQPDASQGGRAQAQSGLRAGGQDPRLAPCPAERPLKCKSRMTADRDDAPVEVTQVPGPANSKLASPEQSNTINSNVLTQRRGVKLG